jgi:hypothetical protein
LKKSNGPTESRRKTNEYSSSTLTHFSWLPTHNNSILSSPDESPQSYYSPIINEQFHGLIQLKTQQNIHQQQQQQQSSYPKTICRHCKSHNMPECLYTCKILSFQIIYLKNFLLFSKIAHTMYDESGAIFCPVLKKCHCATCIRVINSNNTRDDDSDDDINIRLPAISNEFSHLYGIYPQQNSYRMNNNNNF